MRGKQHGDPGRQLDPADQGNYRLLKMRIETDQRLIQQQKFGLAEQGLSQQQPLQFAAGELREQSVRRAIAPRRDRSPARLLAAPRRPSNGSPQRSPCQALATKSQPRSGRSATAARCCGRYPATRLLRPGGWPNTRIFPATNGKQTKDRAQQRGFAGAIGAEDPDKLAGNDRRTDLVQDHAPGARHHHPVELDRRWS